MSRRRRLTAKDYEVYKGFFQRVADLMSIKQRPASGDTKALPPVMLWRERDSNEPPGQVRASEELIWFFGDEPQWFTREHCKLDPLDDGDYALLIDPVVMREFTRWGYETYLLKPEDPNHPGFRFGNKEPGWVCYFGRCKMDGSQV